MRKALFCFFLIFPMLTACSEHVEEPSLYTEEPSVALCTLDTLEQAYRERLGRFDVLSPDELIYLSAQLYSELKLEELVDSPYDETDNLLFQCGTYDWHDGKGERFQIGVSRQIWIPDEDEPYELSITMYYAPVAYNGPRTIWNIDSLTAWQRDVHTTKGYKLAQKQGPREFEIVFGPV